VPPDRELVVGSRPHDLRPANERAAMKKEPLIRASALTVFRRCRGNVVSWFLYGHFLFRLTSLPLHRLSLTEAR
jgi:hypothetical protein